MQSCEMVNGGNSRDVLGSVVFSQPVHLDGIWAVGRELDNDLCDDAVVVLLPFATAAHRRRYSKSRVGWVDAQMSHAKSNPPPDETARVCVQR
jgi:hypothetical protein